MAFDELKFTETQFAGKGVSSLPNDLAESGKTPEEIKKIFDDMPKTMIALGRFNNLIDSLEEFEGDLQNVIKAIKGTATWAVAPPVNLQDAKNHIVSKNNPHGVTKTNVGLGNADNTADINKPVSSPQAAALAKKADLDTTGKVPSAQLPSYVDDVLEYASLSAFPTTGESGKIYITLDTNKTYRWTGSKYGVISETIAIGETAESAYRGDRGKSAYDHSVISGNPHNTTKENIGLGKVTNDAQVKITDVVHVKGTSKTAVMSQQGVTDAIAESGGGDMVKAVYDANNNGKVDNAELADTTYICAAVGNAAVATTYTITDTEIPSLAANKLFLVKFDKACGANATLNINGGGAKAIRIGGVATKANDLIVNSVQPVFYDGTYYQIAVDNAVRNLVAVAQSAAVAAQSTANGAIPNSKKSNAFNSTSTDTVATSAAVRQAYVDANAAYVVAVSAVPKVGGTITGNLIVEVTPAGRWGGGMFLNAGAGLYFDTQGYRETFIFGGTPATASSGHIFASVNSQFRICSHYDINVYKPVAASAFVQVSSGKDKKNEHLLDCALDELCKCNIYEYERKSDGSHQIGLITEDETTPECLKVETQIFKEVVKKEIVTEEVEKNIKGRMIKQTEEEEKEVTTYELAGTEHAIDIYSFVSLTAKAVQELKQKNDALKALLVSKGILTKEEIEVL